MTPESTKSGKHTFPSEEKLKSRKSIQALFENGKAIYRTHIRIIFSICSPITNSIPAKFSVSVSKRNFKKAVDRNRIKRLIREAYRLNKQDLINICLENQVSVEMMWIWTKPEILEYLEINEMTQQLLQTLIYKIRVSKGNLNN